MFDGTPILLSARGDFPGVADDSVAVGAIGAIQLLERIEVGKVMPVEDQIIASPHLGDAIGTEAGRLVEDQKEIEQDKRYDQSIDKRCREYDERVGVADIAPQGGLHLAVASEDFLLENDSAFFDPETQLGTAPGQFRIEFALERTDSVHQVNLSCHRTFPPPKAHRSVRGKLSNCKWGLGSRPSDRRDNITTDVDP